MMTMMMIDPALERVALKLCRQAMLHQEGRARGLDGEENHARARLLARREWLLPALANLIARHHGNRSHDFALHARRFIDEQTFIDDGGDPIFDPRISEEAQTLVDLTVRVHRAVHHQALHQSEGSRLPCAPQMCG
jgi:hypothetical protein